LILRLRARSLFLLLTQPRLKPSKADSAVTVEFRTWEDGFYFKIKIGIQDGSLLFAREFYNQNERHYSYRWQASGGNLLIRWDDCAAPPASFHISISQACWEKYYGQPSNFSCSSVGRNRA